MVGRRLRRTCAAVAALAIVAAGCGGREVNLPEAAQVPAPSFVPVPDDLADSFQLAAIPARDTAGLPPDRPSASTEWLPDALAALAALDEPPSTVSRISIYNDTLHVTYPDPDVAGRSIVALYRQDEPLRFSDPRFDDSPTYPLDLVEPDVPDRIRRAIESRFPNVHATDFDLDFGLSYGFGLVWYVGVHDARGQLATVFADLDGSIIAVDEW